MEEARWGVVKGGLGEGRRKAGEDERMRKAFGIKEGYEPGEGFKVMDPEERDKRRAGREREEGGKGRGRRRGGEGWGVGGGWTT